MHEGLRLFVLVFAAYRLARLVATDEGPYLPIGPLRNEEQWGLFERLRILAGVYDLNQNGHVATNLARGLSCPLCMGLYAAAAVLFLTWLDWGPTNLVLIWLGVSGAQVFLVKLGRE